MESESPKRERNSVLHHIRKRELGAVANELEFVESCGKRYVPITTIIDRDCKILRCYLLGFTASATHLVSYVREYSSGSEEDAGGFDHRFILKAQFWNFNGPDTPLTLFKETVLFDGLSFDCDILREDFGELSYIENERSGLCLFHYEYGASSLGFRETCFCAMTVPYRLTGSQPNSTMIFDVCEASARLNLNESIFEDDRGLTLIVNTGAALKIVSLELREDLSQQGGMETAVDDSRDSPFPWWTVVQSRWETRTTSTSPHIVTQYSFDMEVYMMEAFQSSFKGRIDSYDAKVVAYQENAISILFHNLQDGISQSKYWATAKVNASSGEVTLVNGIRSYTVPEQGVVPNLAMKDEGISPRKNRNSAEAGHCRGRPNNLAGIYSLDDRAVREGKSLSRLDHPLSTYVIVGYHGVN
uniref:Uncharacterized protein n=1 Tax=Rhodosorus marinus TaxID=101924 RepID=A0A7S0BPK3_9RHOD|mmetsp:Transcript_24467/g.35317  ORF Transcript_24467/g.35317 Transcript_24467/m.35317 type:complete len:415 (+) Transcript_24467:102-1346(+)|eukprot:CAMPEP_0184750344 /NCGR_PEP_ID=MMETSP0315-20130426/35863_1 /TAXON_ID=101924 /ORGANISM="Rhodosorus marinus, Strain UTEX LB 2760" /LENGTH=414 /DNA_ID=CAMNT_0027228459 /DNA_START=101 /DNA_END=1345 /DNA_ORIENTATION=-